ncbi:MAG: glycosyltransferase family 2 protein [Bacteroidales bacterium]|nr:glycosyltransferase family 2 protein [Bacteroidales bacterium]
MLSIVVPLYNEVEVLISFHDVLYEVLNKIKEPFELIYVDDGSTDGTAQLLEELHQQCDKVNVIFLTANFGHEAAMVAGLNAARGEYIFCMDGDLQHPPSMIPHMFQKIKEGYELVLMRKSSLKTYPLLRLLATRVYYCLLKVVLPHGFDPYISDFFVIKKRIRDIIVRQYVERTRLLRGILQSLGFKKAVLDYEPGWRKAGKSKYSFTSLGLLSLEMLSMFSEKPLRIGILLGFLMALFATIVGIYSLVMYFIDKPVSGYTTIVVLLSLVSAFQFILLGIIGNYVGFVFREIKKRPLYLIERTLFHES